MSKCHCESAIGGRSNLNLLRPLVSCFCYSYKEPQKKTNFFMYLRVFVT
jgi:hypothetical protein